MGAEVAVGGMGVADVIVVGREVAPVVGEEAAVDGEVGVGTEGMSGAACRPQALRNQLPAAVPSPAAT
jgi:hypothetical protein